MLRRDAKIKSSKNPKKFLLFVLALTLFVGCTVIEIPAPKQWECTPAQSSNELQNWHCRAIATGQCLAFNRVADEECDYIGPGINGTNSDNN